MSQAAFPRTVLEREVMAHADFFALYLAGSGELEPLGGSPIGLKLRHLFSFGSQILLSPSYRGVSRIDMLRPSIRVPPSG